MPCPGPHRIQFRMMTPSSAARPYERLLADALRLGSTTREARMQWFVDAAWESLHPTGVSWIGFYTGMPGREEMVLAARRDKPACSPIGLHGACGQSFTSRTTLIVTDVAKLGPGYIACDPRDRSELVIPLLEAGGGAWGVLDADSYDVGSFGERDAEELWSILVAARLTSADVRPERRVV